MPSHELTEVEINKINLSQKYVNKYPHVKVSISCQSSMETIQALEQDKIDIGFIGYPVSKNSLTYKPVMEIHDTFVCTKQYLDNFSMREKLTKEKYYQWLDLFEQIDMLYADFIKEITSLWVGNTMTRATSKNLNRLQ